tara:strand:+ start:889 stop:1767 length:879 start_codon:yes stop_codon:yes gene_type:complete
MAEDKQVKKYFENMPYGNDSKSSEIHGKTNQVVINRFIASLVAEYDKNIESGDKEAAGNFNGAIKQIAQDLDNLKAIKEEFAMNYGGGHGGKNLFSNYTDLNWDRAFMIEQGNIAFNNDMRLVLSVAKPDGEVISKRVEDITENWVVKGTEETDFMQMQQDARKQRNTLGEPLDFDVDWAIDKLLKNGDAAKIFTADDIGGLNFSDNYVRENQEAIMSGEIPDEMLHPDSFHPDVDPNNRLHNHFANRIKRAFDPNFQTAKEAQEETPIGNKDLSAMMEEEERMKAMKQGRL